MTGPSVVGAAVHRVRLPMRTPHVAAHGTETTREVLLVGLVDADGTTGWGECPTLARPGYTPEHTDGAWDDLVGRLVPDLVADGRRLDGEAPPMAAGAVRDALLDLDLRVRGRAWAAGTGEGDGPRSVPFGVAVGLADSEAQVVRDAEAAVAAGAALVVLKVRPGWAERPVAAVRRALPGTPVAVDANGSFDAGADLDELRSVDAHGPAFVEQPVAADDLDGSARVAAALSAPVSLDESVATIADLDAALAAGAADMVTVKPSRCGGCAAAAALVDRATAAGWAVHIGGMLESGLGRAIARLLAGHPAVAGPSMVGPTGLLFTDDVVAPVAADTDGRVPIPAGPGLAPSPEPNRLDRLTVGRWTGGRWP